MVSVDLELDGPLEAEIRRSVELKRESGIAGEVVAHSGDGDGFRTTILFVRHDDMNAAAVFSFSRGLLTAVRDRAGGSEMHCHTGYFVDLSADLGQNLKFLNPTF